MVKYLECRDLTMPESALHEDLIKRVSRHRLVSLLFGSFWVLMLVGWLIPGGDGKTQPIWKSIPYLLALAIVFLYLLDNDSQCLSVRYARYSFLLFGLAVPLSFLGMAGVGPAGAVAFAIRMNLMFAMLLVLFKDILFARLVENIHRRRLKNIGITLVLLWIYLTWFFAFLYASPAQEKSPLRGRIVSDANPEFDSVNSIDIWYFSVATLTTVGYGDLRPERACRFIACVQMSLGYFFMSIVFGIVAGVALEYITSEPV